jgi:tRNA (guanosine-2'-O-)-methyltransferase
MELGTEPLASANMVPFEAPDRLRRAETALRGRTGRFAVVLERVTDSHNESAVLRSAEAMGIQNIFVVEPIIERNETGKPMDFAKKVTKSCTRWLTVRTFPTTRDCIDVLQAEGYRIWATDLAREAVSLDDRDSLLPIPPKVNFVVV